MGSGSTDMHMNRENFGIIPRAIEYIFDTIQQKEEEDPNSTYKVHVQFLEIYGEDIKDLLDHTKTSKVTIRETAEGDVFVSGAREEAVSSTSQMMRALDDGSRHRTTGSTLMNSSSSRSHGNFMKCSRIDFILFYFFLKLLNESWIRLSLFMFIRVSFVWLRFHTHNVHHMI